MDHRIHSARHRIHREYDQRLTGNTLAACVNLSVSRFTHLFRREIGVSPLQYLKAVRLTEARKRLESTFLSVKEVMASVGLNDASHFARDFKRHHGISPRQVRRGGETAGEGGQQKRPTDSRKGQKMTA